MVKKLKTKTLSSSDKKDKSHKRKSAKNKEDEEESNEEEIDIDEENEGEDEEEDQNSCIANSEESNEEDERRPYDRNLYRNENIFRERDKKLAEAKKKGKNEDESEDEKEEKYKKYSDEEKEQEEAELSENLNESDMEVTLQKKKKKRKKLHKVKDLNKEELMRELDDIKEQKSEDDNERKYSVSNGSQDEESHKNRNKEKYRNNYDEFLENKKEKRRRYKDDYDFIDDGDRPRHRRDRQDYKANKTELLDQEIVTEEEMIIINEDYPERLLTRYKLEELPTLSQEIKSEVEWICEIKNYNDSPNKKKKITTLLELYKKEFYDIPYIITYKNYLFDDLQRKELWEIFELDKEYQKIMDLKKKVINSFNTLEPYLNEKIYHNMKEKCIDNAKTIQELKNMMNYISYNKEKYLSSDINSENDYKGPIRKSLLNVYFSKNLDKCAKQFCLDSNDIASNLELIKNKESLSKLLRPPEPDFSISELLQDYIPSNLSQSSGKSNLSETKVVENLCYLIGKEMINHPYIKEYVYEYLRNNCYVSTNPTEDGKKQLDVFHPSFRTKRIRERPIKTFNDDLFLDVIQREKEK